jgi:TPR repeat protein
MKRSEIRLLALARSGDSTARCEVGRRYLLGLGGFPLHVRSGIEHLTHPSVAGNALARQTLAECLPLDAAVEAGLVGVLETAARDGLPVAQAKLGAWLIARHGESRDGLGWLQRALVQGCEPAGRALRAWDASRVHGSALADLLEPLQHAGLLDALAVQVAAAEHALRAGDLHAGGLPLAGVMAAGHPVADALVGAAVRTAEQQGRRLMHLEPAQVEAALERAANRGDTHAAYALGRALCSIDLGGLPAQTLCERQNMRKGVALLMRAAHGGYHEAWLYLHQVHSDPKLSVANPQLARFCLEKAAAQGMVGAQRRLGAVLLKSAATLEDSECAIAWLHQAHLKGDCHASALLKTLVLPLEGSDADADAAIGVVAESDPWLAARLRLSRQFGLTKLEALSLDPPSSARPWGLVVGRNPYVKQIRLSAPRAVPALTPHALDQLRAVGMLFSERATPAPRTHHGDLRRRSLNQRRIFGRLALDERMFFAKASSTALEALRKGVKWALRERQPLRLALAA